MGDVKILKFKNIYYAQVSIKEYKYLEYLIMVTNEK